MEDERMKRLFATGVCAGGIACNHDRTKADQSARFHGFSLSQCFRIMQVDVGWMVSSDLLQQIAQEYFGDG